ncbi:MAG: Crp/Fnr family transcriptional regulator [Gammaproteobacteria bacterium]|nr:Crp/Fnr family transcriptional regulator [Gammaproteobacteria bacterium]
MGDIALQTYHLEDIYLFKSLNENQLALIQECSHHFHLKDKTNIFQQGDKAERFYFLLSGQVKLYRLSEEGDEKIIELINPGQSFAEAVTFMEQRSYPVNAETLKNSELLSFDMSVFLSIMKGSSDTCLNLLGVMCTRMHKWIDEIDSLTLHNATYRLIAYLLDKVPHGVVEAPEVHLSTPKNIIASRLSIQPETFSRILSRLNKKELIKSNGQNIILRDIEGLRQLLHEDH